MAFLTDRADEFVAAKYCSSFPRPRRTRARPRSFFQSDMVSAAVWPDVYVCKGISRSAQGHHINQTLVRRCRAIPCPRLALYPYMQSELAACGADVMTRELQRGISHSWG